MALKTNILSTHLSIIIILLFSITHSNSLNEFKKKLKDSRFHYTSELSTGFIFTEDDLLISNNVQIRDYAVSGAPIALSLPEVFDGHFTNNHELYQKLETDKRGDATTTVRIGKREGQYNLLVYFLNPKTGYTRHIEHLTFYVTNKTKLLTYLIMCLAIIITLLSSGIFIRFLPRKFLLKRIYTTLYPQILPFKQDNVEYIFQLQTILFSASLTFALLFFQSLLPIFIGLIALIFLEKFHIIKTNFLFYMIFFLQAITFVFFNKYGDLPYLHQINDFGFSLAITIALLLFPSISITLPLIIIAFLTGPLENSLFWRFFTIIVTSNIIYHTIFLVKRWILRKKMAANTNEIDITPKIDENNKNSVDIP